VTKIPAEAVAELVPCSREYVSRLEELGILEPDEQGHCATSDVHVVRLMAAFEEAGISLENVARGIRSGELSFPMGLFMPEPPAMTETYDELGARLERPPELLRRLSGELGVPPRDDDLVRAEDAEILSLMVTKLDLADDEDLSRFARLYGGTVQRLVASGLQFFDRAVRERVASLNLGSGESDRQVYERAAGFTQLVSAVVPWLQRRHRERGVIEYLVSVTEAFMEERGLTPRNTRRPPAIAFLDLTGYTALAEERGDRAAAEVASDLAGVVQHTATAHGGRPVKWLGDGVMFHFSDPGEAILSGLDLIEQTEQAIEVPARIGINAGAVIAQEGDYFGRTVNIAARIADYARPHELLVSEEAKLNSNIGDVAFELIGDVPLKGVSQAVRLHRATRLGD
jgi:class 3 adenylate cyclase